MKQLSPDELKAWIHDAHECMLVDVREEWEHEAYNIGGVNIPMSELMARATALPKDKDVVIYCEKGIRSVIAIQRLEAMGYDRLYNLSGGMKQWRIANATM